MKTKLEYITQLAEEFQASPSRELSHDLCVELWNDIAENNLTTKFNSVLCKLSPHNCCFACDWYARNGRRCKIKQLCPFWTLGGGCISNNTSPYIRFGAPDSDNKALAIEIADLFID